MSAVEEHICGDRIASRIARLAQIGGLPNGGVHRLPYTGEDRAACDVFAGWLTDLGLKVRIDGAGNVSGRREGSDTGAPVVMTGSHLDTQPGGGRFDGAAGVVAGLEVMEAMHEAKVVHRHPIEIVNFAAEEVSTRFVLPMIGSSAMIGSLGPESLSAPDRITGLTLREVMITAGIDATTLLKAERQPTSIKAVVELHIEQGPYLERAAKKIGVVTEVAGYARIMCLLKGQQAHSGGMPMDARRDALCGAAEVLVAIEAAAKDQGRPPVVATVGYMTHEPQAISIIPGVVQMIIDVRSVDPFARSKVVASIESSARAIAERRGLVIEWRPMLTQAPVKLASLIADTIEKACEELGITYMRMASGGGHDAMTMGRRFPAGMLFVPSVGGISHAPEELTRTEDLVVGARVLCRTLCQLSISV